MDGYRRICMPPTIRRRSKFSRRRHHRMYVLDDRAESLQIRRKVLILADGTVFPIRRGAAGKPTVFRSRERIEMEPLPLKTNLVHVAQRIVL